VLGQYLGLPVVCSCRGSDISTGVFYEPDVVTTVITRCTWMIFVSRFLLHMADALVPCRDKATVVPNAVDSVAFSPAVPPLRRSPPLVVGTCGLLRWKKGLDLWLPLIHTLCATHDVRILLAGHGLYDADEQQITDYLNRHGLQDRVERTGPLPHDQIVHALRRMDIYINTSYQEGMPNGVLEAMACGLPVVATDAGDTSYVVEHGVTGYVCPKGDLEAMVARCRDLIAQPVLRQCLGRAARQRIAQVFHLDRECEAIETILRRVCRADMSHEEG
jgi:glycosyltransferase involved in cell wall biosynthesis